MVNETADEQALDFLMMMMDFYHEKLFKTERAELSGIQAARYRLLIQLYETPMLSMSSLGRRLYISRPYMTALVDGLVKDGLVERHYTPDDRRVINVSISDAGRETVRSMKSRIRTQMRGLLSHLPESDLQTLCSCGEKISDVIGKIP